MQHCRIPTRIPILFLRGDVSLRTGGETGSFILFSLSSRRISLPARSGFALLAVSCVSRALRPFPRSQWNSIGKLRARARSEDLFSYSSRSAFTSPYIAAVIFRSSDLREDEVD